MIKVIVEDQSLRWHGRAPKIAADSVEFVKFQFLLSEDWDGYTVTAQFSQRGATYNQLLDNGCCALPAEIEAGKCFISIFGQIPDGPERATVVPLMADVSSSGFVSEGRTPIPPTPDLYAQLLGQLYAAAGHVVPQIKNGTWWLWDFETEEYRDTGVAAVGSGTSGGSGKDGYSPVVTISDIENGTKVVITDVNGEHPFEILDGVSGVYILAEGETLGDVPKGVTVVIDPYGAPDVGTEVSLTDRTTGAVYNLYVDNGKLMMESEV